MPSSGSAIEASSLRKNDGSLPAKFIGSCIRFIQSMIEKVDSVTISFLVMTAAIANSSAPSDHEQRGRLKRLVAGPQDHQHADEADRERARARRRHALAEKQHGEQRDPGRNDEFEREHGRERQHRDRDGPADLRSEMHDVARDLQAHVAPG